MIFSSHTIIEMSDNVISDSWLKNLNNECALGKFKIENPRKNQVSSGNHLTFKRKESGKSKTKVISILIIKFL